MNKLNVEKPLREISIGEIIRQSFSLYSTKVLQLFVPFLVITILNRSFGVLINSYFPLPLIPEPDAPIDTLLQWTISSLTILATTLPLTLVLEGVLGSIVNGLTIKYTSDVLEGKETSFQKAISFVLSKIAYLLAARIITGVLIGFGFICLLVPGIILSIIFIFVSPVIIIEGEGITNSLLRSRRLVNKRWTKTFTLLLTLQIILIVIEEAANIFLGDVGLLTPIISGTITTIIQPISPIAITLYYYSMTARETG